MNRGLGDWTGDLHGGGVKARGTEVHLGVVREPESFLWPANHIAVELVIGVLIVQGSDRVAAGWELEFRGCLVSGKGMAAVHERLVIVFGPAIGRREDGESS